MSTPESKADEVVDFSLSRTTRSKNTETSINLEQLKAEELRFLKKSKSGHLGYLNRIYREIETLMIETSNVQQVLSQKEILDNAHKNCLHAHEKYFHCLEDENEKREASEEYIGLSTAKRQFEDYFEEWFERVKKTVVSPDLKAVSHTSTPAKTPEATPSLASSARSAATSGEDVQSLEVEYKQLARKQQLQRQIAEIKREENKILEDIKKQEEEIERQLKLLETRSYRSSCSKPTPMKHEPKQEPNAKESEDELPPSASRESHAQGSVLKTDIEQLLKQQQTAMELIASSLKIGFEMPKRELLTFDGNPVDYWTFIKNFESNIESKLSDPDGKLTYLIQQCTGKARESIKNCVIIQNKDEAYKKAREILLTRYGQRHVIAHAYINRLVNGPQLKTSDGAGISELALQMQNCQLTLVNMGFQADVNSSDNLVKVVKRLPVHLQGKWADKAGSLIKGGVEPNFEHLTKFVEEKAMLANTMYGQIVGSSPERDNSTRIKPTYNRNQNSSNSRASTFMTHSQVSHKNSQDQESPQASKGPNLKCPDCSGPHKLTRCEKFKEKNTQQRRDFVMQARLCHNCLGRNHIARDCRSENTCRVQGCGRRHHTFLHLSQSANTSNGEKRTVTTNDNPRVTPSAVSGAGAMGQCSSTGSSNRNIVSLRIIPVTVKSSDSVSEIETYALLDAGSDVSLCCNSLFHKLGISGTPTNFSLTTVNGQVSKRNGHEVKLTIKGIHSDEVIDLDKVWTVDKLSISTQNIPTKEDIVHWPHLSGIDIPSIDAKEVTLLVGSDVPEAHWVLDQRRGKRGQPYAVRTPLGWTLMGPIGTKDGNEASVHFLRRDDTLLHQQVERMFKGDFNEPMIDSKTTMSLEDRRALHQMEESIKLVDGHYQLALPWKRPNTALPNNRVCAEGRLRLLKKRLQRDPKLLEKYRETMNGYINDDHARALPVEESTKEVHKRIWYLPHHPVVHPQKPNKLRVVFDCAARYKDTSLNDNLLQGPDLTNSLVGVLVRFRQERIALASDVKGMFHQVRVDPDDCNSLRFLWWPDGDLSKQPTDHQMLVHLFGATSSPSCASFSLRRVATDNQSDFNAETIDTVNKNFYVDDCLKSVPSTEEAIKLASELRALLSRGGFNLTKWVSNDKEVLATIPKSERAASAFDLDLEGLPTQSTLGLQWDMQTDTFNFRTVKKVKAPTRRGILSTVSAMYDPLGFAAPVILPAKQLLQGLCSQNYGWDEAVSESELTKWDKWLSTLPKLQDVKVPRCFKPPEFGNLHQVELHHFSDASQTGYGAVSYIRLIDTNKNIHCSFVMGKSRVAPLKTVSIPRLELSAAVVSIKLNSIVNLELEYPIDSTTYWTDSTSVLKYIRNQSRRFQTFIANRVATIQDSSESSQWKYVSTTTNPADIASRGINDCDTAKLNQWLNGPEFLWRDESTWPLQPDIPSQLTGNDPEVKKEARVNVITQNETLTTLIPRYSSWYRLQKAVAWITRFKAYLCYKHHRSKSHTAPATGPLTVQELKNATKEIIVQVQRQSFPDEYALLESAELYPENEPSQSKSFVSRKYLSKNLGASSVLRKLNPVLDDKVLRVGGRLERAPLTFEVKHPIIIPSKHHLSELIIRHYHVVEGHCGPTQVLSSTRQKFWIIRGHSAVRRVLGNCIDCKRRNASLGKQIMAPLPAARLTPSEPPFTRVGVDYFGPLLVKRGRSHEKRYGCLFTCFSIRAVHIEIAHTLESDSFICAYQRFVSRRGRPKEIFSDNGTNFKGAERELREALQRWNQDKISNRLHQDEVQWHFNPPEASHQGGVWERMIRSVRKILRALLLEQVVNDETLLTLMAEVERILNDRPLTVVSDSPDDPEPLTPSKLLLLKDNASVPLDVITKNDVYNKRWRTAQCLANAFWRRWIREYLPTLQLRQKWTVPHRNFKVGDLVLIVDDRVQRGKWPKGLITDVYPDKHGIVRQVHVKTSSASLRRDIRKLCLLEGHTDKLY